MKSLLRAAWKMEAKAAMACIRRLAERLGRDYPSAPARLLGGAGGMLHHHWLGLPFIAALPGDGEHHREFKCWSAYPNLPLQTAKWLEVVSHQTERNNGAFCNDLTTLPFCEVQPRRGCCGARERRNRAHKRHTIGSIGALRMSRSVTEILLLFSNRSIEARR